MDVAILVAEGLEFPEGPVACSDGSVIVTEIAGRRITRVHADGGKEVLAETGGGPNGAAIGPDGALWICNNGGSFSYFEHDGITIPGPTPPDHKGGSIQRYDFACRRLETVYESCDGRPLIGPNDIVFDAAGRILVHRSWLLHRRRPPLRRLALCRHRRRDDRPRSARI